MKIQFRHLLLLGFLLLFAVVFLVQPSFLDVFQQTRTPTVIVLDVGHGGFDPGKISSDGLLEKDINLAIALRLKEYLEAQDCQVYMTRDTDRSLADTSESNQKRSDMQNRIALIKEVQPTLMISIHQNSFSSPKEHGAQTFYYYSSDNSKLLAESIQSALIEQADPENTRVCKSNDSYYILKNTDCPAVIVECGFLSNPTESALLNTAIYQDKLAYAISVGARQYLNQTAHP